MATLLTYDPTGAMFSPIPADQYKKLIDALKTNSKVFKLVIPDATGGSCEVQGVDFAWLYDGANSLHVGIVAKHGLFVKAMPNASIFDHLNAEFNAMLSAGS